MAASSSEMSVIIYQSTWHIPENLNLPNIAVSSAYIAYSSEILTVVVHVHVDIIPW